MTRFLNRRSWSVKAYAWDWGPNSPGLGHCALVLIILLICVGLTGCGSTTSPTGNGLRADDRFLYGGSDEHKLRYKQHAELGDDRGDEYCHHAGDIHVHIRDAVQRA